MRGKEGTGSAVGKGAEGGEVRMALAPGGGSVGATPDPAEAGADPAGEGKGWFSESFFLAFLLRPLVVEDGTAVAEAEAAATADALACCSARALSLSSSCLFLHWSRVLPFMPSTTLFQRSPCFETKSSKMWSSSRDHGLEGAVAAVLRPAEDTDAGESIVGFD